MKWPSWVYRLVPYLGRRQAEEDLQEELRLHLELERGRQRDAGVPEADALRAARRRLGNATLIRERTRDVWSWRRLDDLGRDVRHALRGLGRSPGFAAAVVLVLALGIGANTAMFGIVYGMLLRPLPYPDAGAIVRVGESLGASGVSDMWLSNRSMPLLEESAESFEELAAYQDHSVESASLDGAALAGARVSPALFPLLRAAPHLGRLFREEEARVRADRVVLLSHAAWTRRFASDPDIVGTLVDLDGDPHTVVGVLAEGFHFPNPDSEFWTPYVIPPSTPPSTEGPAGPRVVFSAVFRAVGRLRPGVSPAQAATEARTILQRSSDALMARVRGNRPVGDVPEVGVRVVPLAVSPGRYSHAEQSGRVRANAASGRKSRHLEAMGFRLRAGRTFTRLDGPESPRVLVANETLVRELFGGEPAVGRRVLMGRDESWEVIGVVEDIVYGGFELTAEPRAEAFFPLAQIGDRRFGFSTRIFVTIRTTGDSLAAIPFLREAATAANPQATLGPVMTMEARLSAAVAQPRFYAVFIGSLAGLALLLVAFGIYGLLSYTVAQRRGEIGIRMALGARRGDILGLVVTQGAALLVVGCVIGMFAAAASSRVLENLLYGVTTDDPLTFIAAPLMVVTVALVACWLPARRAARVDPMKTLRFE